MKTCLECDSEILAEDWKCEECAWEPESLGNICLLAPHISGATESYDPVWYEELASLEAGNFWFVARNNLIRWMARKYCPQKGKYLEVGCGTGFVLKMLNKSFPGWVISATEIQPESFQFARKRVAEDVRFFQMDACNIPFRDEFDVIGAFDVIEHIRDDVTTIGQIHTALKPDGIFILSVPQHMFLWSKYDEVGCHFRRYSKCELENKLKQAGFNILVSTSFNSLLLPLMMISRYLNKKKNNDQFDVLDELRTSKILNFLLTMVLKVEFQLVKFGLNMPLGGSRFIVAKKINKEK